MKKIYLAFLIVVGSVLQCGNAQTVSSGGGKLAGSANELLSGLSRWVKPNCMALIACDMEINHEIGTDGPEFNSMKGPETASQLDSVTVQMADAAIMQMEEQTKTSLQDSVGAFINSNAVQDHDIMTAIGASKRGTAAPRESLYIRQLDSNDILELIAPGLLADRESFARDVVKALLPYALKLDDARR